MEKREYTSKSLMEETAEGYIKNVLINTMLKCKKDMLKVST